VADAVAFGVVHDSLGEDLAVVAVLRPGASADVPELRAWLAEHLTPVKVPRQLHVVPEIPRPNGKVRRSELAGLLAVTLGPGGPAGRPPQSPVAKAVARLWSDLLGVPEVHLDDDFFALGGDSLRAARFVRALGEMTGDVIYVSSVFEAQTVAGYERHLREGYPRATARLLGQALTSTATPPLDPQTLRSLREVVRRPAPSEPRPAPSSSAVAFVLSAPRSGSTLLRAMLAGHPRLFAPPELYLLPYASLVERQEAFAGPHASQLEGLTRALVQVTGADARSSADLVARLVADGASTQAVYELLQSRAPGRRLVDKTPANALRPATLQRAEAWFQDPVHLHLVRHPYGMIRSFEEANLGRLWWSRLAPEGSGLTCPPDRVMAELVWLILNENIAAFLDSIPDARRGRIRYEDLVSDPERELRRCCRLLAIEFVPTLLTPYDDTRARMTDGLHGVSRMIGDPSFHRHRTVDAGAAQSWYAAFDEDFLSPDTWALARSWGYGETVESHGSRVELSL
jgi:hypothetical protein